MFHENKFSDKGCGFRYAISGGIADTTLLAIATQFKTGVSRKYKTLPARLVGQTFTKCEEVLPSVKYDGEGVNVFFDAEKEICTAFNAPSGRARIGLPCLKTVADALKKAGIKKALLVAEIYLKTSDGKRSRSGDVAHVTANGSPTERENLALAFHDAIMIDGKDLRENQKACKPTWDKLGEIFGEDTSLSCHRVEGKILKGSEVEAWFKEVTETRGLEGGVVRFLNQETIYKIKPSISIDAVVVGYVEGDFEGMYGIMSLLCALTSPDGKTLQILTRVGSGFDDTLRQKLLEPLSAIKISAPLTMTDSEGRPIIFVKPQMVVEVEGETLSEITLDGQPITSQTLQWDGETLSFTGISNAVHLTHATLAQLRPDKIWDDGGTRMDQAISQETIKKILTPKKREPTEAKIIHREVFIKTTKGEKSVRKLLVVERNAEEFHKFTIHWTDFSASRKDPFQTETKGVDTQERLNAVLASYEEEISKKGWEKAN